MKTLKILIATLVTVCSIAGFGWNQGKLGTPARPPVGSVGGFDGGFRPPFLWNKPPIFQLGDWNSAGVPMPPYDPPYPYSYKCQAQLSDQLRREGAAGKSYQFFAVADFRLTDEKWQVQSEELQWFGKKLYSFDEILDTKDPIPFSTEGSHISLTAYQGYPGVPEKIELSATVEQKIGSLIFSDRNKESTLRAATGLSTSVYLNLRTESGEEIPRMMLRVLCTKEN